MDKKLRRNLGVVALWLLLAVLVPSSVLSEEPMADTITAGAGTSAGTVAVLGNGAGTIGAADAIAAAAAVAVAASQSESPGI